MEVRVLDLADIGEAVAREMARVVSKNPEAVVGLTTGTTPLATGLYKQLVERQASGGADFSRARFVSPDEWVGLSRAHPECYHSYTKRHFLDHLPPAFDAAAQWLVPDGNAVDLTLECQRLDHTLHAWGGIDLQLLGVGQNGHVCFIEPADELPAAFYVTPIAESNRVMYAADFAGDLAAVPTHAVTYGLGTLLRARKLLLVAVGAKKAALVARALTGPVTPLFPASFLQTHPDVTVYVDHEAAAALPPSLASRAGFSLVRVID
jgi:glucosamine-6-phosphate deaminase